MPKITYLYFPVFLSAFNFFSNKIFPPKNFLFPIGNAKMCHTNLKKLFVPLDYLALGLTLLSFDSSGFEVMFSITSRIVYIAKYVQNMYKLVPVLGAVRAGSCKTE